MGWSGGEEGAEGGKRCVGGRGVVVGGVGGVDGGGMRGGRRWGEGGRGWGWREEGGRDSHFYPCRWWSFGRKLNFKLCNPNEKFLFPGRN